MEDWQLAGFDLAAFVRAALDEDLGVGLPDGGHDVTSESVIPADARFSGVMDSRDAITVAGLPIAAAFFRKLDPAMEIEILAQEGEQVPAGTDLMRLTGNARATSRTAGSIGGTGAMPSSSVRMYIPVPPTRIGTRPSTTSTAA